MSVTFRGARRVWCYFFTELEMALVSELRIACLDPLLILRLGVYLEMFSALRAWASESMNSSINLDNFVQCRDANSPICQAHCAEIGFFLLAISHTLWDFTPLVKCRFVTEVWTCITDHRNLWKRLVNMAEVVLKGLSSMSYLGLWARYWLWIIMLVDYCQIAHLSECLRIC